jgi:septal ring factor EnvC (AmiA/AmiB activator)
MGNGGDSASETLAKARAAERNKVKDLRDKMAAKVADKEAALKAVRDQRKDSFNPYENLSNEFANLGVATQAAEFQAEETDIALANTLDAMQASGAGAGGATALAQAALKSKRGISASIQQQEKSNQDKAAQGAANVAKAKAEGEKFKFSIDEQRNVSDLNRASKELDNQNARVDSANAALLELDLSNTDL